MAGQLSIEERERISQLRFAGVTRAEIARQLNRARSTISRELKRNSSDGKYSAVKAEQLARERRKRRPLIRKMEDEERREFVVGYLVQYWSPEQISGRLKRMKGPRWHVSHQTIYTWIKSQGEQREHWESFLRRGGRRRPQDDRRGKIPRQVEISKRPKVVDRRNRLGDWEGDTVVGRGSRECLVTLVDRKSGFLRSGRSKTRTADRVGTKIIGLMKDLPGELRKTMTLDNGKEFAEHERVSSRLDLDVYFAHPYCSWERGTNENTNGLLRQFIPKGKDIREVSHQELRHYVDLLNHRPRKRLGYRTPAEVLNLQKYGCN